MSLGLTKTKRRIHSVQSTQKITKAMELVASVKLKRFRREFETGDAYTVALARIIGHLFAYDSSSKTHYSKENEDVEGSLYIVITSNLGLCAGYNNEIFKYVDAHVDPEKDMIFPIGEKGKAHFTADPRYKIVESEFSELDLSMDPRLIGEACQNIKDIFNHRVVKKVVLVYTRYVNSLSFVPDMAQLLPVSIEPVPYSDEEYAPPIFEPSAREQIHLLLPQYLASILISKLNESQLSEQASRRRAMENANDNADELLSKLTIEYNKARQASITQEIVEVVSGSNQGN
jgi:F-type H+-transporting ATPase subunit gamma